jgi:hypothetical protein
MAVATDSSFLTFSHPTNSRSLVLKYYSGLIGYYALLSASMGEFNIDSFEPNLKNNIRACESIRMNNWYNEWEQDVPTNPRLIGKPVINVWPAGVSDMAGTFKFFESYGNPAGGRFGGFGNNRTDYSEIPVTTLDTFAEEMGWFKSRPEIAILQMSVERYDPNVLVGAQELLGAGIVQNIFTEVTLNDPERRSVSVAAHELLVQAGYKLKGQGGWSGPGKDSSLVFSMPIIGPIWTLSHVPGDGCPMDTMLFKATAFPAIPKRAGWPEWSQSNLKPFTPLRIPDELFATVSGCLGGRMATGRPRSFNESACAVTC